MKSVTTARAVVAARKRHNHSPEAIADAEVDLRAAKLAAAIQRAVDAAPPLTDEQRRGLARLLSPVGGGAR